MPGEAPLLLALKSLPEDLWARSQLCPRDRVLMLSATSKGVRKLLIERHWRVPTAVRVRPCASVESVAEGLKSLMASRWCSVVSLEWERGTRQDGVWTGVPIKEEGARSLTQVLWECSSITMLNLGGNDIGAAGTDSLALATLNLSGNQFGPRGAEDLAGVLLARRRRVK